MHVMSENSIQLHDREGRWERLSALDQSTIPTRCHELSLDRSVHIVEVTSQDRRVSWGMVLFHFEQPIHLTKPFDFCESQVQTGREEPLVIGPRRQSKTDLECAPLLSPFDFQVQPGGRNDRKP